MIYFKIKLEFKFRKNKIYCYITVNFHTGLCYKIHYTKNKNYPEKRTAGWYIVISLLLQPLTQRFIDVTSFRLSKSLYSLPLPFKDHNNFDSVFTNHLDCRIWDQIPVTRQLSLFLFYISCISFNFPLALRTFLLFFTVAMLSLSQFPVKCRSSKAEGNFMPKVN